MRISCLPWGVLYHRHHTREAYVEWFRFVAQDPHLEGVDPIDGSGSLFGLPERREESRALKPMLDDLGLNVVMFTTHVDFRVAELAPAERDRIRFLIDQAVFFEAACYRTITGLSEPGELCRQGVMENVLAGLRWLAGLVAEAGLPLLIENHHETTDEMIVLCDALAAERVKLNVEIKPAFRYHLDPYAYAARLAPRAGCFHLDNFRYDPDTEHWDQDRAGRKLERAVALDQGEIDLGRILKIVKAAGYDGWVSIEYGGLSDGFDNLARSAAFVRRTWDALP